MLLTIEPPAGNTRGPVYTESLLRTLHRILPTRIRLTLQLRGDERGVGFAAECPDQLRVPFLQELQDAYPGTIVSVIREHPSQENSQEWTAALRLNPDVLQIRTAEEFRDETDNRQFADPVAGLISAIRSGVSGRVTCRVELTFCSASASRIRHAQRVLKVLGRTFHFEIFRDWYVHHATSPSRILRCLAWFISRFSTVGSSDASESSHKLAEPLFECWLTTTVQVPINASKVASKRLDDVLGALARFNNGEAKFIAMHGRQCNALKQRGFLLSARETASLEARNRWIQSAVEREASAMIADLICRQNVRTDSPRIQILEVIAIERNLPRVMQVEER